MDKVKIFDDVNPVSLPLITDKESDLKQDAQKVSMVNLAYEFLKAGLRREELYRDQLDLKIKDATAINETIKNVIDLRGKLPYQKELVITDELRAQFKKLEDKGIHLIEANEKKLSPERLSEISAQIDAHRGRLQTELNSKFTTDINLLIQELNTLLDVLRTAIKTNDRAIEMIQSRYTKN